ncbi:MAG: YSC84-related protein [Rhizobacter sp.]
MNDPIDPMAVGGAVRRRLVLAAGGGAALLAVAGCTTTGGQAAEDPAAHRRRIEAGADAALTKLYTQVPAARELVAKARGVLVFPEVISAGFVVGGSYGEGTLRASRRTAGYYKVVSAAFGLMAGAQSRAVYLLFMTQDALDKFEASNGWTAGVDASVALASVGANGEIDARALRASIIGFVVTNVGLMANLSLEGTRFIKADF